GLRFLAASAVIITHIELLKQQVGLASLWDEKKHPFFYNAGGLGVYFFFVLSGFLITYLLLSEKKKEGKINVRNFYLRRIFRIWPVYYLLVILAFFVFPHIHILHLDYFDKFFPEHFGVKLLLYLFLLPNLALAMFHSVPHAGQAWSIGVEEQFYIVWPWVVRKTKNVLRTIIYLGTGIVIFKVAFVLVYKFFPGHAWVETLKAFIAMTKIECMAIGGLGACLAFDNQKKWLDLIFNPIVQLIAYALLPVLIFFLPAVLQDGEHLIYSFCFLVIIMNVALNPRSFLKFETRSLNFLGNISYAMYMFHMFIVVMVLRIVPSFVNIHNTIVANIAYYSLSFGLTIGFCALSYYLYEKPFIRLKKKFTSILSGSDALKKSP
ncbi:MAG TPA: acyltransferase, partial [Bacteroidia bacterium]|nr:acyltransferase [Bacteroidia bacterium]